MPTDDVLRLPSSTSSPYFRRELELTGETRSHLSATGKPPSEEGSAAVMNGPKLTRHPHRAAKTTPGALTPRQFRPTEVCGERVEVNLSAAQESSRSSIYLETETVHPECFGG
jgi:hypothetical protein